MVGECGSATPKQFSWTTPFELSQMRETLICGKRSLMENSVMFLDNSRRPYFRKVGVWIPHSQLEYPHCIYLTLLSNYFISSFWSLHRHLCSEECQLKNDLAYFVMLPFFKAISTLNHEEIADNLSQGSSNSRTIFAKSGNGKLLTHLSLNRSNQTYSAFYKSNIIYVSVMNEFEW